ncbi:hypothetical protein IEO21_01923 [Rhodonia placenta]|uniref:Uncharacterized protein n=1 Tax=Rhodonia placenta TaxID=104341 RepID=A0A8H7P8J7_9APHY|nr:hypothetical protein IEO21_01923 [Postia placenta]
MVSTALEHHAHSGSDTSYQPYHNIAGRVADAPLRQAMYAMPALDYSFQRSEDTPSSSSAASMHRPHHEGHTTIAISAGAQECLRDALYGRRMLVDIPTDLWHQLRAICEHPTFVHIPGPTPASSNRDIGIPAQPYSSQRIRPSASMPLAVSPRLDAHPMPSATTSYSPTAEVYPDGGELDPSTSFRCQWGNCNGVITSPKFSSIETHLKAHHFAENSSDPWIPGQRGHCKWSGSPVHTSTPSIAPAQLYLPKSRPPLYLSCGFVFSRNSRPPIGLQILLRLCVPRYLLSLSSDSCWIRFCHCETEFAFGGLG